MEPFDISSNHRIIDVIIRAPRNIPFRDGLLFFIVVTSIDLSLLSSPRAKHAGPKGLHAESARAVTGRQCPHSGEGEDFDQNLGHMAKIGPNEKVVAPGILVICNVDRNRENHTKN